MPKPYQLVVDYFISPESRIGYDLVLGGVKHFGYYPSGKINITEKKAQVLTQDLLANKLQIKKTDYLLDAGCGQGFVATYLAKKFGCKVTGITITPFEVEKARDLAVKREVTNKVDFFEMDYAKTKFPNNTFDAIYTMESFVHAYDMEKTLKEFKRILKPAGRITFFEYSIPDDKMIDKFEKKHHGYKKILDWVIEKGAMFSLKKLRHGALPSTLGKIGFDHITEENITRNISPSIKRLINLAKIFFPIIKLFRLQNSFVNATTAAEFFPYLLENKEAEMVRYNITFAKKA